MNVELGALELLMGQDEAEVRPRCMRKEEAAGSSRFSAQKRKTDARRNEGSTARKVTKRVARRKPPRNSGKRGLRAPKEG